MLLEDYSMTKEIEFVITFFFFSPSHFSLQESKQNTSLYKIYKIFNIMFLKSQHIVYISTLFS